MPARTAAAATLCILVLAGCGGAAEDREAADYAHAVDVAQTRFSRSIARIGADAADGSAASVDRLDDAVAEVSRDLRSVDPPERVGRRHDRLIAEIDDFGAALRVARRGLATGDRAEILRRRDRLLTSARRATRRIDATIASINRALRS